MNTTQGLLSSHTSAQTPPSRKEPLYLENTECTCIDCAREPLFPRDNIHLPLPQSKISSSPALTVITGRSSSFKPNVLPKHSLIFLSQIQNRACFRPCPSCLQSVAQSGATEFPFGETGRRTNPLYQKDATSCSPQVCNKLSWVAYWGTEKGTTQFRQGFCPAELLHN